MVMMHSYVWRANIFTCPQNVFQSRGERAFSVFAPELWKKPPLNVRWAFQLTLLILTTNLPVCRQNLPVVAQMTSSEYKCSAS